jgi:two-component system sensor histidine kinase ChvG
MTDSMSERMDAIERFAADVAHEIKNPLTSIRSAIETLDLVTDPAARARLLGILQQDVTRLDRLVTDISNASRLDAELSREAPRALRAEQAAGRGRHPVRGPAAPGRGAGQRAGDLRRQGRAAARPDRWRARRRSARCSAT